MPDDLRLRWRTEPVQDPGDLAPLLLSGKGKAGFYFEQPSRRLAIAALGVAAEFRGAGADRFEQASATALTLLRSLSATDTASTADAPLVVGGFGFSDRDLPDRRWREFPAAWLYVPDLLWVRRAGACTLTRVWRAAPGARGEAPPEWPPPAAAKPAVQTDGARLVANPSSTPLERDQWRKRVERVRSLIARGALSKVVLARKSELEFTAPLDPVRVIAAARSSRPACFTFWIRAGESSFLGSSPELLVRTEGERVTSSALAGSAPRGRSEAEDSALGEALFQSAKELEEHDLVVSAVRGALAEVADPLQVPDRPRLMILPEAQHLYTPVEGRLRRPRTAAQLAGLLHPTPAVCGVPLEAARAIIEREEPDRGWYTGAVGWMNARGEGEFAVALRSALIEGRRMSLWAGAGIVAASDPDLEFAETEAKMMALIRSNGIAAPE
jgi:menaquinone-specific isochorismate synthase